MIAFPLSLITAEEQKKVFAVILKIIENFTGIGIDFWNHDIVTSLFPAKK